MGPDRINLLTEIGMSKFEAEVYIALLKNPNQTGYKIANITGKALPNTYKALNSLQKKGAVVAESTSKSKQFTAVPIEEYMDRLESKFSKQREAIVKSLRDVGSDVEEEGIYRIEDIDQIAAKARRMIEHARNQIVVDAYPDPLNKIKTLLEQAAERGVRVFVHAYEPIEIKGAEVNWYPQQGELTPFPWSWLNMMTDASESLLSYLDSESKKVFHAFWSRNPYLGNYLHNGTMHEFMLESIRNMLYKKEDSEKILEELHRLEMAYYGDIDWTYHFYGLFSKGFELTPVIEETGPMRVAGAKAMISWKSRSGKVTAWKTFRELEDKIPGVTDEDARVSINFDAFNDDKEMKWSVLIGKLIDDKVTQEDMPDGIEIIEVPKQLCAHFVHEGKKTAFMTYRYIFYQWLPQSEWNRQSGYDLEFSYKSKPCNTEGCRVDIHIPVSSGESTGRE